MSTIMNSPSLFTIAHEGIKYMHGRKLNWKKTPRWWISNRNQGAFHYITLFPVSWVRKASHFKSYTNKNCHLLLLQNRCPTQSLVFYDLTTAINKQNPSRNLANTERSWNMLENRYEAIQNWHIHKNSMQLL